MGSTSINNTNAAAGKATGTTSVFYKVTEKYTWSIPATIDFGVNAGVNNTSTVEAKLDKNVNGEMAEQKGTEWKGTAPKVTVSENVIGVGKTLKIAIDMGKNYADTFDIAKNKFYVETRKMTEAGPSVTDFEKLYFTITKTATGSTGTELNSKNDVVMSVPSGTNKGEQALEFKLETTKETAEKAGDYVGYVWFYSELV